VALVRASAVTPLDAGELDAARAVSSLEKVVLPSQ